MKRCCLLASLMSIILPSLAGTIYVSGGGNALQKAIDKAKAGDILFVEPGTYSAIDTQGKEIEIRSTKGPKQTFLTCGKFKKPWAKILKDGVWFAALLVSDEDTDIWWSEDSEDEHFGLGVEWRDWTPMDIVKSRSTLVGFTITSGGAKIPSVADTSGFAVNGGRVFNCIFEGMDETSGCKSMGYVHAAEVCNCLLVARDIGSEIVCDCSVRNCTVVVDSYVGPWDSPVVCCELLNTILWFGQQYEIDNGSSRPRFENVVCRNVKWEEDVDPMFADIKNGDYALAVDSPCIDAGNNAYSAYDCDLNGGARIVNGTVDIGAYEYGSTPLYEEPEGLESFYGPFVPGEKVALTIPALVGYTAKGLPSGLKLNKKTGEITGAARKPTGEAGVTVTFTKKDSPTLTAQFVVGPIPTINVALEGDAEKCKVTGANKAYLVGKKVSLQAKAPKGTAFVGWFRDGEPWPSEEECLEPKIKYVMEAENLDLVARFKAEEVSVACDISAGCVVKEQVSFPVVVDCESGLKSVSAKKLPSGLKYNKKTGCIEGAAKKAGTYPFSLTVTTKAGSKVTQSFALVVGTSSEQKMPEWAVGTFEGYLLWKFVDDQWLDKITWTIRSDGHVMAVVSALDYYANVDVQTIDLGHLSVNRRGQLFVEAKYWDEPSVKLLFFVEKGDDSFAGKMTCHQVGRMARHGAYELRSVARQDVWGSHAMSFEEGMSLELNMEDLPYQEDTQFNDCKSKGWLTLNFKNDGMVDVFYRTAQVGDVVARGMSRLYPYAETKDRGVLATCIMILEPHNQYMTSFVLSLDFSIDVMRGDVDATDIVVVDNLLGTDTGPDFISAQSL